MAAAAPAATAAARVQRYMLKVTYHGAYFGGSAGPARADAASSAFVEEARRGLAPVQTVVGEAISMWTRQPVSTFFASRTDAGVHATDNALHVDIARLDRGGVPVPDRAPYEPKDVVHATNFHLRRRLPGPVPTADVMRVTEAYLVPPAFHARFDAKSRKYVYQIYQCETPPPIFDQDRVWHFTKPLKVAAMQAAGKLFIGEHDFTSFRNSSPETVEKSAVRRIFDVDVQPQPPGPFDPPHARRLAIVVHGRSFVYHQVRNMVNALCHVGSGAAEPSWIRYLLQAKDRFRSTNPSPSHALFLVSVDYGSVDELQRAAAVRDAALRLASAAVDGDPNRAARNTAYAAAIAAGLAQPPNAATDDDDGGDKSE